ncbi:MAG TPA: hypothetical protein VGQ24_13685 [Gemmatimonadales bacterium]|jgi:hypothetical protein|nr:hypothetical protein [Gemmatimonadales bacterium]
MQQSALHFSCACALAGILAAPVEAQVVRLATPNARLAEEFSAIRGVRELADGRVLLSDYIDQRVVLVDLTRGSVVQRVGKGGGPTEARLPTRLIPVSPDTTILVDLGNNRLLLLDGEGRAVRTIAGERPGVLGVRGVDAGGALYYAVPGWAEQHPLQNDSVRIVKWKPRRGTEETLAVVQGERMRSDIRQPALTPRIPLVGYGSQDGWVVAEGGVVWIVRTGGYRVERRVPGSPPVVGPSYAYPTRAVSEADRLAFVREFLATSPTSGKGEGGGMGFSPTLNQQEVAEMLRGTQFAERHPLFDAGRVIAAPGGRLWVGRPAEPGKPVLYDVFDETGRRLTMIELLPARRIIAIGRQSVYIVAESESGIQHLERYPLPR